MAEHSPEPWKNLSRDICDANGRSIGLARTDEIGDRVVACVNACRGLNPEHVPELVDMVEGLLPFAQLAQGNPSTEAHAKLAVEMARKLLAKVKT